MCGAKSQIYQLIDDKPIDDQTLKLLCLLVDAYAGLGDLHRPIDRGMNQ
jgi:hypothetical protein